MINVIFSGECPQCLLVNHDVVMQQNSIPFWECPECQLQILIEKENALIMRNRGKGYFENNLKSFDRNCILEETKKDSYPSGKLILDLAHLEKYIKNKVQPVAEFTYTKLIDSFVNYKYNNQPIDDYLRQSEYFKINFEDANIEKILIERDRKINQNPLYLHSRLYRFLNDLFKKYNTNDNSWLPEMGMSKIEYFLCTKHFPSYHSHLINANPILIKRNLKELIIDLIKIIYLNERIMLSPDTEDMKMILNEMKRTMTLAEFKKQLTEKMVSETNRPFICRDSPLDCTVFIVGINPATETSNFWDYWKNETGFNFDNWFNDYIDSRSKSKKIAAISPTRRNINLISENLLKNIKVLETNVFNVATKKEKDIMEEDKTSHVFDFLLDIIKPKLLLVHGKAAQKELSKKINYNENQLNYEIDGLPVMVLFIQHLSYQFSKEKAIKVSEKIQELLNN